MKSMEVHCKMTSILNNEFENDEEWRLIPENDKEKCICFICSRFTITVLVMWHARVVHMVSPCSSGWFFHRGERTGERPWRIPEKGLENLWPFAVIDSAHLSKRDGSQTEIW
jgi:hypothetical protein